MVEGPGVGFVHSERLSNHNLGFGVSRGGVRGPTYLVVSSPTSPSLSGFKRGGVYRYRYSIKGSISLVRNS